MARARNPSEIFSEIFQKRSAELGSVTFHSANVAPEAFPVICRGIECRGVVRTKSNLHPAVTSMDVPASPISWRESTILEISSNPPLPHHDFPRSGNGRASFGDLDDDIVLEVLYLADLLSILSIRRVSSSSFFLSSRSHIVPGRLADTLHN